MAVERQQLQSQNQRQLAFSTQNEKGSEMNSHDSFVMWGSIGVHFTNELCRRFVRTKGNGNDVEISSVMYNCSELQII